MNLPQLEQRIDQLAENPETPLAIVFQTVCKEFSIDGQEISGLLGCECPYGLLGYLQEAEGEA